MLKEILISICCLEKSITFKRLKFDSCDTQHGLMFYITY